MNLYQILLLNEYYSIPFSLYPYHMNQKQFKRDKLYYKTVGLIMHDRHIVANDFRKPLFMAVEKRRHV